MKVSLATNRIRLLRALSALALLGVALAFPVDRRLGGGNSTAGFQWQWSNVENAVDIGSENLANDLYGLDLGSQRRAVR